MEACFTSKASERQEGFLPVLEAQYQYPLFPNSITLGRAGQQTSVEFRKPETPQELLRPEEGRGLLCAPHTTVIPVQEPNPDAAARSHP